MLTAEQRRQAQALFRTHGYGSSVRIARPVGGDEVVFVLPSAALIDLPEATLTAELQQALGRKVWITAEGPDWPDTELLI